VSEPTPKRPSRFATLELRSAGSRLRQLIRRRVLEVSEMALKDGEPDPKFVAGLARTKELNELHSLVSKEFQRHVLTICLLLMVPLLLASLFNSPRSPLQARVRAGTVVFTLTEPLSWPIEQRVLDFVIADATGSRPLERLPRGLNEQVTFNELQLPRGSRAEVSVISSNRFAVRLGCADPCVGAIAMLTLQGSDSTSA
jgi:hypothetical protein